MTSLRKLSDLVQAAAHIICDFIDIDLLLLLSPSDMPTQRVMCNILSSLKGLCYVLYLSILLKAKKVSSHQLNSKSSGLIKDYHATLKLFPVATDGKDGNELKLENIGPFSSSFDVMSSKFTKKNLIMVFPP